VPLEVGAELVQVGLLPRALGQLRVERSLHDLLSAAHGRELAARPQVIRVVVGDHQPVHPAAELG
jgi:hypothetical protein